MVRFRDGTTHNHPYCKKRNSVVEWKDHFMQRQLGNLHGTKEDTLPWGRGMMFNYEIQSVESTIDCATVADQRGDNNNNKDLIMAASFSKGKRFTTTI